MTVLRGGRNLLGHLVVLGGGGLDQVLVHGVDLAREISSDHEVQSNRTTSFLLAQSICGQGRGEVCLGVGLSGRSGRACSIERRLSLQSPSSRNNILARGCSHQALQEILAGMFVPHVIDQNHQHQLEIVDHRHRQLVDLLVVVHVLLRGGRGLLVDCRAIIIGAQLPALLGRRGQGQFTLTLSGCQGHRRHFLFQEQEVRDCHVVLRIRQSTGKQANREDNTIS